MDQLDGLKDGYALSELPEIPDIGFWFVVMYSKCYMYSYMYIHNTFTCTYTCMTRVGYKALVTYVHSD